MYSGREGQKRRRLQPLSSQFCPIEWGRGSYSEQRERNQHSTSPSATPDTSSTHARPGGGTCGQVVPTDSRDYQTLHQRDQGTEIFLIQYERKIVLKDKDERTAISRSGTGGVH